jgi:subtilisin family serine protease
VISVGAINTRTWFENIDDRCMSYDGNIEETGKVVYWSSRGPNLSGEIVPTVVAPGHNILSALNHYAENQYKQSMFTDTLLTTSSASDQHYKMAAMSGTSMSTPVVSGVIALWLQANPTLTTAQVKEVMAKTSHHTADEDVWPNNDYGYGVIDAYAGLLEVLQLPSKIQDISTSQPAQTKIAISDKTLTISTIEGAGPLRVRIYSTNGVLVGEFMTDRVQSSFDLGHLPSGIYAVQVTGNKKSVTGSTLIRL